MTTIAPATATIYTNEWNRISGRLRPTYYLLAITAAALLLGSASGLANQNILVAIEAFCIGIAVGSALVILLWRRGDSTEINLGSNKIRSGKLEASFEEVLDLDLHAATSNLYLIIAEHRILLPLMWLDRGQVKIVESMMRLLNNPTLPEGRVEEVRQFLLEVLSN